MKRESLDTHIPRRGGLSLILGPMFSGKTSEMMRQVKRRVKAGYRAKLIKYAKDDRYDGECIVTHDKRKMRAIKCVKLGDAKIDYSRYDVIGVDEGQFYPDLIEWTQQRTTEGIYVIIAALDGMANQKPFPNDVISLVAQSEVVVKLDAICALCSQSASFTRRTTSEEGVEVIGGDEKYIAVCRHCLPVELYDVSGHPIPELQRHFDNVHAMQGLES